MKLLEAINMVTLSTSPAFGMLGKHLEQCWWANSSESDRSEHRAHPKAYKATVIVEKKDGGIIASANSVIQIFQGNSTSVDT